jgi:hypothetical protein
MNKALFVIRCPRCKSGDIDIVGEPPYRTMCNVCCYTAENKKKKTKVRTPSLCIVCNKRHNGSHFKRQLLKDVRVYAVER